MGDEPAANINAKDVQIAAQSEPMKFWCEYVPAVPRPHRSRKMDNQVYHNPYPCFFVPQVDSNDVHYKAVPCFSPYNMYANEQVFLPVPPEMQASKNFEGFYGNADVYIKPPRSRSPSPTPFYYQYGDHFAEAFPSAFEDVEKYELPSVPSAAPKKKSRRPKPQFAPLERRMPPETMKRKSKYQSCQNDYTPELRHFLQDLDAKTTRESKDDELDILNQAELEVEMPSLSEKYFGSIQRNLEDGKAAGRSSRRPARQKSTVCMCSLAERMKSLSSSDAGSEKADKATQTVEDCARSRPQVESEGTQTEPVDGAGDADAPVLKTSVGKTLNPGSYLERLRTFTSGPEHLVETKSDGKQPDKEYFKKAWPSRY